jgi:DNA-binding response OmpR family regulator
LGELWVAVLELEGAQTIGPIPTASGALALLANECPDAAVLDVNLADGLSYPVARELTGRAVPYVIVSASDVRDVPEDLRAAPFLAKPTSIRTFVAALAGVIRPN